ncbi:MAG: GTP-binding protein [Candidatus Lokiarchaeota archaeon]|nr:GTP-binding protein [Candidatus Lokiarchaeota archaeon]
MSSYKFKIVLTGAATVGKTRLIQKFIKNRFQANYKLTVGVDILTKDVEFRQGEIATLSIWDIGEQQRFDFIRSIFYKGSAGALLVFDLTREQTYIEIRKGFTEIKKFAGSIPFILIGNKIHLLKMMDKAIIRKEAREFAKNEGGIYIETSPNRIDDIEEAVRKFTCRIIESRS